MVHILGNSSTHKNHRCFSFESIANTELLEQNSMTLTKPCVEWLKTRPNTWKMKFSWIRSFVAQHETSDTFIRFNINGWSIQIIPCFILFTVYESTNCLPGLKFYYNLLNVKFNILSENGMEKSDRVQKGLKFKAVKPFRCVSVNVHYFIFNTHTYTYITSLFE